MRCRVQFGQQNMVCDVVNLSRTGIGIRLDAVTCKLGLGTEFTATLLFQDQEITNKFRVVWQTNTQLGCRMVGQNQELAKLINLIFDLEIQALKLSHINPDFLKKKENWESWWYRGPKGHELFFVEAHSKMTKFHIHLVDITVEWYEGGRELICHEVVNPFAGTEESKELRQISMTDEIKERCRRFVINIEDLFPDQREQIIGYLN